ncbi:ribonuclease inhibitor-like [Tiliqua scincoides]|uniref:ribonuclease inhibitor-like n=1 Tax=Tiliqua scincoides TaxID=71010 RepID=UPI00346206FA
MKQLCEGLKHPNCRILQLLLYQCHLTSTCCEALSSVFHINQTLIELDLQGNNIGDSGMSLLCEGLKQPNCKLQKLHLDRCGLTAACCQDLSSVLCSNQALTELHLSTNKLEDSGVRVLCQGLKHACCRLKSLLLHWCDLTAVACGDLASVLSTNQNLTKLCLSRNTLGDSGVSRLCEGLRHPDCRLQHLLNNSSLQVLEFWENDLGDLGVSLLCEGLKHPNCNLQDLGFKRCNITSACCDALASVLMKKPSLKLLRFSEEKLGDAGVSLLCEGLRHPNCKLQKLMFWQCDLTAACCEDLTAVLCSNQSLGELKIRNSKLGDAGSFKALEAPYLAHTGFDHQMPLFRSPITGPGKNATQPSPASQSLLSAFPVKLPHCPECRCGHRAQAEPQPPSGQERGWSPSVPAADGLPSVLPRDRGEEELL